MYTKYGNSFVTLLLQEIPIEPRRGLFFYLEHPLPASLWKFLFNVFALNVLGLILSLPTRISNDPWWGGCGNILEPNILNRDGYLSVFCCVVLLIVN